MHMTCLSDSNGVLVFGCQYISRFNFPELVIKCPHCNWGFRLSFVSFFLQMKTRWWNSQTRTIKMPQRVGPCFGKNGRHFNCVYLRYLLHEIPQCLSTHVCIFPQFSHKASVKRVSAYQTWVFLYPAFQFSIDLGRVTLKRPEKHRSTKKSWIPFLHQKDSLGPGWFSSQARHWCRPGFITWWLEPERNRGGAKYQIAFGGKLYGLVLCPPSILSSVSLSLSVTLF